MEISSSPSGSFPREPVCRSDRRRQSCTVAHIWPLTAVLSGILALKLPGISCPPSESICRRNRRRGLAGSSGPVSFRISEMIVMFEYSLGLIVVAWRGIRVTHIFRYLVVFRTHFKWSEMTLGLRVSLALLHQATGLFHPAFLHRNKMAIRLRAVNSRDQNGRIVERHAFLSLNL